MKKLSQFVLYVILIGLAAEVVFLGLQTRKQKEIIRQLLADEATGGWGMMLEAGDRLTSVAELVAPDGAPLRLQFGPDQPQRLLLVFNTRCQACVETIPGWNRLAQNVGGIAQVLAVTNDAPAQVAEYVRRQAISYPAYSFTGDGYRQSLRVRGVPQTILVDGAGNVLGIWAGVLSPERAERVENLLGGLPALQFAAPPPLAAGPQSAEADPK